MTIYHALKDYQEVMTRGDYLVFDTPLTCRFIGHFFRFENQKPCWQNWQRQSIFSGLKKAKQR